MSGRDLREWTVAQVRSAMTAAMRTDPNALDALAEANAGSLDAYSLSFLRTARTWTLATTAALTTVLGAHRYGRDSHDRLVCLACGIDRSRNRPLVRLVLQPRTGPRRPRGVVRIVLLHRSSPSM